MLKIIIKVLLSLFALVVLVILVVHFLLGTELREEPVLSGEMREVQLTQDGHEREYLAYIPENRPEEPALLLVLHGAGGTARLAQHLSGFSFEELADQNGFILVYPQGYGRHWNDCRATGTFAAREENIDDAGFLNSIIDHFVEAGNVNRQKVFVAGYSNGGHMAFRLALEAPFPLAGIAVVAANLPAANNLACQDQQHPLPVLIMNGTADRVNPFNGGEVSLLGLGSRGRVMSTHETARMFVRRNGLPQAGITEQVDETRVLVTQWLAAGKPSVKLYALQGGGHTLPQPRYKFPVILGKTHMDFNGPRAIWSFFQSQSADNVE